MGPPPGWYADPWHQAEQRYWDGGTWGTQLRQTQPPPPELPSAPARWTNDSLAVWGVIGALFFAPAGVVIGCVLLFLPGRATRGVVITGVSFGVMLVAIVLLGG